MKTKLLTCVSTMDRPGIQKLEHSLKLFNYDYEIMVDPSINWNWGGWPNFYKWAKEQVNDPSGYTHFIYTDGFDTLALGPMDEIIKSYQRISPDLDDFVYSTEKNLFPTCAEPGYPKTEDYPINEPHQRWQFINGGQYMTPVKKFIEMYEKIDLNINSQHWAHQQFLWHNQDGKIKRDINCEIFQSVAFSAGNLEGEFTVKGENVYYDEDTQADSRTGRKRLFNNFTKTKPVIAHGNGMGQNLIAEFQFVYDILGL